MPKDPNIKAAKKEVVHDLDQTEQASIALINKQYSEANNQLQMYDQLSVQLRDKVQLLRTTTNLFVENIARRHGLVKADGDKITLDPSLTKIIVETDDQLEPDPKGS